MRKLSSGDSIYIAPDYIRVSGERINLININNVSLKKMRKIFKFLMYLPFIGRITPHYLVIECIDGDNIEIEFYEKEKLYQFFHILERKRRENIPDTGMWDVNKGILQEC